MALVYDIVDWGPEGSNFIDLKVERLLYLTDCREGNLVVTLPIYSQPSSVLCLGVCEGFLRTAFLSACLADLDHLCMPASCAQHAREHHRYRIATQNRAR